MGGVWCNPGKSAAQKAVFGHDRLTVNHYKQVSPFTKGELQPTLLFGHDEAGTQEKTSAACSSTEPAPAYSPPRNDGMGHQNDNKTAPDGAASARNIFHVPNGSIANKALASWIIPFVVVIAGIVFMVCVFARLSQISQANSGDLFDCFGEVREWSYQRKHWCCRHRSIGCESTTSAPFDCKTDYYNWRELWVPGKKAWCCDQFSIGCPASTTPNPFDCTAGVDNWAKEWSISKKAWCCENELVACPGDSESSFRQWGPARRHPGDDR